MVRYSNPETKPESRQDVVDHAASDLGKTIGRQAMRLTTTGDGGGGTLRTAAGEPRKVDSLCRLF